jgi:hypothetical protein
LIIIINKSAGLKRRRERNAIWGAYASGDSAILFDFLSCAVGRMRDAPP